MLHTVILNCYVFALSAIRAHTMKAVLYICIVKLWVLALCWYC